MPVFELGEDAILAIALAFVIAGLVKGAIGGGLPGVAVPIMANSIDPAIAASITLIPVLVTNFWLMIEAGRFHEVIRRYWPFLSCLTIGSALGAQILVTAPPEIMALVIGIFVVLMSPLPFIPKNWAIPEQTQRWLNPVAAGGIGALGGATVIFAPVIVYFVALRIDKDLFAASLAAIALASMTAVFTTLAANRVLASDEILLSILTLVPTILGMLAGIWL